MISVRINFQTTVEDLLYFELLRDTKINSRWADSKWLKNYIWGKIDKIVFVRDSGKWRLRGCIVWCEFLLVSGREYFPSLYMGNHEVFYRCIFSPGHCRISFITLCFNMYTQLFRQDWLGLQKTWCDINEMIIFTLKRSFQYSETNWWQLSNLASFSLQQRQIQHRMR